METTTLAMAVSKLIYSTPARPVLTKLFPLSAVAASFKISSAMFLTAAVSLFAYWF